MFRWLRKCFFGDNDGGNIGLPHMSQHCRIFDPFPPLAACADAGIVVVEIVATKRAIELSKSFKIIVSSFLDIAIVTGRESVSELSTAINSEQDRETRTPNRL